MYSDRSSLMFRRNLLTPSSGLESKPDKLLALLAACSLIGFRVLFDPEERGSTFLRHVSKLLDDMESHTSQFRENLKSSNVNIVLL
jgi:hypothetical protein